MLCVEVKKFATLTIGGKVGPYALHADVGLVGNVREQYWDILKVLKGKPIPPGQAEACRNRIEGILERMPGDTLAAFIEHTRGTPEFLNNVIDVTNKYTSLFQVHTASCMCPENAAPPVSQME